MSRLVFSVVVLCIAQTAPAQSNKQRQLGAHEHGHGTLNIAVEGSTLTVELEVPGDDIVGFEHDPSTPEEIKATEAAKSTLAKPLTLFELPAAAMCTTKDVKVAIVENDGEDHKDHKVHEDVEVHHSIFQAAYRIECGAIQDLKSLNFAYFGAFKSAQSLTVNVITPKGQSKFETSANSPKIDLSGLM